MITRHADNLGGLRRVFAARIQLAVLDAHRPRGNAL
jgi:hypothetical protein